MVLQLPDLDTGRFLDLADEARASIPRWSPGWTDHNLSDPGITLTELVAAEVDQLMYRVNRITDRDRRTLLRLIGYAPVGPTAAHGTVAFSLADPTASPRTVPAGVTLVARNVSGGAVPIVLREPVRVGPAVLGAVLTGDDGAIRDVTRLLAGGGAVAALGDDPSAAASSALYVGLRSAPEVGRPLQLALALAGNARPAAAGAPPAGATFGWECLDATGWQRLGARDGTAGLTRTGRVELDIDRAIPLLAHPAAPSPCAWLRCRLVAGRPDAPPALLGVALHAGAVAQVRPLVSRQRLAAGLAIPAAVVAGTSTPLGFTLDPAGAIAALSIGDSATPDVPIYAVDTQALLIGAAPVGHGLRQPRQRLFLPAVPVVATSVAAWVVRPGAGGPETEPVRLVDDLDGARPHATVAVLDAAAGALTFGDGRRGRMLAPDELIVARAESTLGGAGNIRAASSCRLDVDPDGPNGALLGTSAGLVGAELAVALPWGLDGGADAEQVAHAAGRAARRLAVHEHLLELAGDDGPATLDGVEPAALAAADVPQRALTAVDLERIVRATPGRAVARCRAFAETEATLPGIRAAGTATVVVLPSLPRDRPQPTPGLLDAVRAEVDRCRIVGSRVVVSGPTYVEVTIRAAVVLVAGRDRAGVLHDVRQALVDYLHPLHGGPLGRGWPFGRDVYRADVLAVIDGVDGVDDVDSLELAVGDGPPTCGNVCVPRLALVASGAHELRSVAR